MNSINKEKIILASFIPLFKICSLVQITCLRGRKRRNILLKVNFAEMSDGHLLEKLIEIVSIL